MISIERESVEPVYVTVTDTTTGLEVTPAFISVASTDVRPTVWVAPTIDAGRPCYPTPGNLAPGYYYLYAKITASPWASVILVDTIRVI